MYDTRARLSICMRRIGAATIRFQLSKALMNPSTASTSASSRLRTRHRSCRCCRRPPPGSGAQGPGDEYASRRGTPAAPRSHPRRRAPGNPAAARAAPAPEDAQPRSFARESLADAVTRNPLALSLFDTVREGQVVFTARRLPSGSANHATRVRPMVAIPSSVFRCGKS